MILSNDAKQVVKRFRIPRLIVWAMFLLSFVPVGLLFYYANLYTTQQQANVQLTAELEKQTGTVKGLQEKVAHLEKNSAEVEVKMKELKELEAKMRQYITELPLELEPIGGITVSIAEHVDEDFSSIDQESTYNQLIEKYKQTITELEETNNELRHIPTAWPTNSSKITSEFGVRTDPFNYSSAFHTGIDIEGNRGAPVYAGADGIVVLAEYYGGYGNAIIIRHSNTHKTLYGHLSKIKVQVGDQVKKGEMIGLVGSTGRSTGPHLHYEVLKNGVPIDPSPFMYLFSDNQDQH